MIGIIHPVEPIHRTTKRSHSVPIGRPVASPDLDRRPINRGPDAPASKPPPEPSGVPRPTKIVRPSPHHTTGGVPGASLSRVKIKWGAGENLWITGALWITCAAR
ncbi:hypothetical protein GCM10010483_54040 [Actinokineospora diospyrosa]